MWDGFNEFLLLITLEASWHKAFASAMKVGCKVDRASFLALPVMVIMPMLDYARYKAAGGRELAPAQLVLPHQQMPREVAERMMARRN